MKTPEGNGPVAEAREAFRPRGLATGIGSLPHRDPVRAVEAVLARVPVCPFWPQLPRRSPLESMTLQYLEGLPGRPGKDEAETTVDTTGSALDDLPSFYERVLEGRWESFAITPDRAAGFYAYEEALVQSRPPELRYVKGHVTGPVTLATSLKDPSGRDLIHDDTFREALAALVAQKGLWQVRRLERFGVPAIVFLDEPVMEVYGSAYSTLSRELVLALWAPAFETLGRAGALTAVHCCGNTDWGLLFESGVDIVNFDSFNFLPKMLLYPEELSSFLRRGGALAWGAIPTSAEARDLSADELLRRLDEGIRSLAAAGVDEGMLRTHSMLTPACGMGSLDPGLAERILDLLGEMSSRFEA